jgi:NSS family neurotransmitter:Na+ symporter
MLRDAWISKVGFILSAMGSAIGLTNIIRFPYLAATYGGGTFLLVYILCLILISYPVLASEVVIGRTTNQSPAGAFFMLTKSRSWYNAGRFIIFVGLIISGFYSVITGWILGYLVEFMNGNQNVLISTVASEQFYAKMINSPSLSVGLHGLVIMLCALSLYLGVRKGIERISKVLMPLMIILVFYLVYIAIKLPNATGAFDSLLSFDRQHLSFETVLAALGQAFFTLSLGQGTMITYGSYLSRKENILKLCLPIVIADTIVSLLATMIIFAIVHSTGMQADVGLSLLFKTIPNMFGTMQFGMFIGLVFFILIAIAAVTSEMSVIEPIIAYIVDQKKLKRKPAVLACCALSFVVGIPSALSYSSLIDFKIMSRPILEFMDYIATGFLIPMSALLSSIVIAWFWNISLAVEELGGLPKTHTKSLFKEMYFTACVKYIAPIVIVIVSINCLLNY